MSAPVLSEILTVAESREILKHPVFGNAQQIAGLKLLDLLEEVKQFSGKSFKCTCCHGSGETSCAECYQRIDCHACDGTGEITLDLDDEETLAAGDLYRILELAKKGEACGV